MMTYEERYQVKRKSGTLLPQAVLLVAIIITAIFIAGGFTIHNQPGPPPPGGPGFGGVCCDSGDGDACVPQKSIGQTLTFTSPTSLTFPQYKGVPMQYDLLKSNAQIYECFRHGKDSGTTVTYPSNAKYPGVHPVIFNNSQELGGQPGECPKGFDQMADFRGGKHCASIPDDELVYVCVKNCEAPFGTAQPDNCQGDPQYGNSQTVYDIYMRDADYPAPGVPDVIKNCQITSPQACPTNVQNPQYVMSTPVFYQQHKTLQLHTFYPGLSYSKCDVLEPRPFCKPALYFYPQQTEKIHVHIAPKGKITYTNPVYPPAHSGLSSGSKTGGWDILASPNGALDYQGKWYDYLYYEAAIPDSNFEKEELKETKGTKESKGYVIAYNDLANFFDGTLPKLGLNDKETNDFKDYWLKALPNSPYYKISLVPQNVINDVSPLTISPMPDTLLRITLNFQPLETKISITNPVLPEVKRTGFTVVEWGGTFKQDKNHPFTCLQ